VDEKDDLMTDAPGLPAMSLADMQHWVSVVGRMQQLLMEFSLRQVGKLPETLTKTPDHQAKMRPPYGLLF
jgi:hypothetical protein